MYNLYTHIAGNPVRFHRLSCGESLLTVFNCGLKNKYEDLWSHHNYILYVAEGRKIWHTTHGSYDLQEGSCVFVKKGACIVEQFFDAEFCFFLFFVPDEFICEVLKTKSTPIAKQGVRFEPVMNIDNSDTVKAFFQSMQPYFGAIRQPDQSLLELKFRELILTIADNPVNREILSYFGSLLQEPHKVSLQRVMEENFCYNLKLEAFARLCARSLSAFKRDFEDLYQVSPGKWLMEKRLDHALLLLTNRRKTVTETAFESGFESLPHFSRAFRQRFGASPAAIRQQSVV